MSADQNVEGKTNRFDTIDISGPKLKVARRHAKITQKLLAEPVGISRGYVGVIERESQIPVSRRVAEGLAGILKVDVSDLEITNEPENLQPPVFPHRQRRKGIRGKNEIANTSEKALQDVLVQLETLTATVRWLIKTEKNRV